MKVCVERKCDREHSAHGLCAKHYMVDYNQRPEVKKREREYRREYSKNARKLLKKARRLQKIRPDLFKDSTEEKEEINK